MLLISPFTDLSHGFPPYSPSLRREKPRPALPLNAGAPSSKISADDNQDPDPLETGGPNPGPRDGEEEEEEESGASQKDFKTSTNANP